MELSSELVIQAVKWVGSAALAIYGGIETWRIYNKRKEVEAREKSLGQTALDLHKMEIEKLKERLAISENKLSELAYKDENIKCITEKLEVNYTSLMNRLIDSFNANR